MNTRQLTIIYTLCVLTAAAIGAVAAVTTPTIERVRQTEAYTVDKFRDGPITCYVAKSTLTHAGGSSGIHVGQDDIVASISCVKP